MTSERIQAVPVDKCEPAARLSVHAEEKWTWLSSRKEPHEMLRGSRQVRPQIQSANHSRRRFGKRIALNRGRPISGAQCKAGKSKGYRCCAIQES